MREITVDELAGHDDVTLIDVREPDEFAAGHVPGALNIPLGQLSARVDEVPAGPVDVICHLGARSLRGAKILEDAGRSDVVSVAGGTSAWIESGRAVDR
ncbi:MAG: rhodanese-like domain-containing protein [Micrococcales bacterium]|nr:rhodanese-like domain-containing protein [Micrococcales bacterium]